MINLKKLNQKIKIFGYSDEKAKKLIDKMNEFRYFNEFMIKKYHLTNDADVEILTNNYIKTKEFNVNEKIMTVFKSMNEDELKKLNDNDIEKIGSEQIKKFLTETLLEFAKKEKYNNIEKLHKSINIYVNFLNIEKSN